MVPKERFIISRDGSNDRCRESFKVRICEMGPVCRPRFRAFKEEDGVEDGEFADTLKKAELLDHDNCMWLSSGGASSPSSCFQHDGLFGYMDLKIDAWFISLLSTPSPRSAPLLSTKVKFFDGSRVNPMEEATLVLDQRNISDENVVFQENLDEEEEVVSWLVTSIKNESPDTFSALTSDGDAESSYGQSSVKDSTKFDKFSSFLSNWTPDKRSELAYFRSDLSTPVNRRYQLSASSVSSVTDSSDDHSIFSSSSSSDYSSDVVDLEEIDNDKPLFWPSDWASQWSSETKCDLFIMSPRKDIHKAGNSPKASHHFLNPRVPIEELDSEKGRNRRVVFGTASKSLDLKKATGVNDVRKTRSMPRFRKSTTTSKKTLPLHNEADSGELTEAKAVNKRESTTDTPATMSSEPAYTQSVSARPVCKRLQLSASSISSVTDTSYEDSFFSSSSSSDHASEVVAFEDTKTKSPVFWPSGCASDWGSDTKWDFFVMSPRKDIDKVGKSPKTSPDALRLRGLSKNTTLAKGCSRRLEFSPSSKEVSMATSTKTAAIGYEVDTAKLPDVEVLTRKAVGKHKIVLEDLLLVDKLNVEGAIEDVLGLSEFDGREGVESNFNKDEFSLVEI